MDAGGPSQTLVITYQTGLCYSLAGLNAKPITKLSYSNRKIMGHLRHTALAVFLRNIHVT